MVFEITTVSIARVRGTTPFVWSMGNVWLNRVLTCVCIRRKTQGRGPPECLEYCKVG